MTFMSTYSDYSDEFPLQSTPLTARYLRVLGFLLPRQRIWEAIVYETQTNYYRNCPFSEIIWYTWTAAPLVCNQELPKYSRSVPCC